MTFPSISVRWPLNVKRKNIKISRRRKKGGKYKKRSILMPFSSIMVASKRKRGKNWNKKRGEGIKTFQPKVWMAEFSLSSILVLCDTPKKKKKSILMHLKCPEEKKTKKGTRENLAEPKFPIVQYSHCSIFVILNFLVCKQRGKIEKPVEPKVSIAKYSPSSILVPSPPLTMGTLFPAWIW